ncbi:hypothetical protein FPQ18DRAFT_165073 [Pyronema domesticum]|nr:hypothetical protein FPQ18DRAFT_165073 [Pyronema domesticum]
MVEEEVNVGKETVWVADCRGRVGAQVIPLCGWVLRVDKALSGSCQTFDAVAVDLLQATIQLRLSSLSGLSSIFPTDLSSISLAACRLFPLFPFYSFYSSPPVAVIAGPQCVVHYPTTRSSTCCWLAGWSTLVLVVVAVVCTGAGLVLLLGAGCCCWCGLLLVWSAAGLLCRESGSESVGFLVGRSAFLFCPR